MKRFICKGTRVHFVLDDGSKVHPAKGAAALHDPEGRAWPACSILISEFPRAGARQATDDEMRGAPKEYLGRTYKGRVSKEFDLPPRALSGWSKVATVATIQDEQGMIYYSRGGTKYPGRYRHRFNKGHGLVALFKGKGKVTLYERGRFMRLELPRGCRLDERGIVWP